LKEARADFDSARSRYSRAIELAEELGNPRLIRHRLFLNNLALLIIDEVQLRGASASRLLEARGLLEEAARRVRETGSDFHWPEESLSLCAALIEDSALDKTV
jgi:hypothetical protein